MNSFIDLLVIYRWSLPASIIAAGVLAMIGAQWTAREKSAQIFVLGQGTSLGIVLGLALNILLGVDYHILNLVLGFSVGGLTLLASEYLVETKADRNHVYFTLFVIFLALTYLLTSLVPSLESHIASSYFGDLAVMSDGGSILNLVIGILFGGFLWFYWKPLSMTSFHLVNHSYIQRSRRDLFFDIGTLVVTTLTIQNMGYLFTIGSLFISTTLASRNSRNLRAYFNRLMTISVVGCFLGFLLSLLSTNLPTVPCVLLGQVLVGCLLYTKK
ncbi:MAG: metal ABC transporter permease [Bdellovibrio sp.]|nr:metal ABC transporter permease [Bdellovibrio sp.]